MRLSPADRLLCDLLAAGPGGPDPRKLQGLGGRGWDELFRRSVEHKVAPLLHRHVAPLVRSGSVPEAVGQRFRAVYLNTLGTNTRLFFRLAELLGVLERSGIRAVVLKGAHLAEAYYGSAGLRPMCDLDILVERGDLPRTLERLRAAGFFSGGASLNLDVHTRLCACIAGPDISTEAVMARARTVNVGGRRAWGLGPEDLLLHLILHLSVQDLFAVTPLRGLCDVRQVVLRERGALDWQQVARRAGAWGAGNGVRLTLMLLDELLGLRVPDASARGLGPEGVEPRARTWALEQMFGERPHRSGRISPYFWDLWRPGSARGRAAAFKTLLFPPRDVMLARYGAREGARPTVLSYLVRFRTHLGPYARTLRGLAAGEGRLLALKRRETRNLEMQEWLCSG